MEKAQQRDFKGIWIPREIWLSGNLSLMEKVLFVEIHSLDNERGCFASNRYFADFFDVSDRQIRNIVASLRAKGFVTVTVHNKNERVIRTAGRYRRISDEEKRGLSEKRSTLVDRMSLSGRGGRKFPGR
ncbi:MAG: helix-turn-helix domain-containing protein [Chthoniobacteraceae bacterium]